MITNSTPLFSPPAPSNTTDIRALKPPIDIPNPWLWVWVILVVLMLAAILFCVLKFWKTKAAEAVVIPPVPPHKRARLRLQEALAMMSQPRPFCILVSDTVRLYLEERFNFHAPERTTEEFLRELQSTELLAGEQKESLGRFLESCDLVKFAKYEPGEKELQELHHSAVQLVEETEPDRATSAPVAEAQE